MDVVITKDDTRGHIINRYKFRVFATGGHTDDEKEANEAFEETQTDAPEDEQTPQSVSKRDELVESLLQKTDEMSSNFINLQLKLEEQEKEHKEALQQCEKSYYEKGLQEGQAQELARQEALQKEQKEGFLEAIKRVDSAAQSFQNGLQNIENELIEAALQIAKEVVMNEISLASTEIAKTVASKLVEELSNAASITLKVNPHDYTEIAQHLSSLQHVNVVADSAVALGGVIALSESGNIDADIQKRFDQVKASVMTGK